MVMPLWLQNKVVVVAPIHLRELHIHRLAHRLRLYTLEVPNLFQHLATVTAVSDRVEAFESLTLHAGQESHVLGWVSFQKWVYLRAQIPG